MPFTESFTGIIGYVNRRNPDGVFTGVDKPSHFGYPTDACANNYNDALSFLLGLQAQVLAERLARVCKARKTSSPAVEYRSLTLDTRQRTMANGCGNPFYGDDRGPHALQAWFASQTGRIDPVAATRQLVNSFPSVKWEVRDVFGFGEEYTFADLYRTVDGFRAAYGPIGTAIGRQFKRENIFMVGGNYVVNSENEWVDQLIIRGEVAITPNKRLTNDLAFDLTEKTDVVSALILEKYQRFSQAFPATYLVAQ